MTDWQELLDRVASRPAVIPTEAHELKAALMLASAGGSRATDALLADAWIVAQPIVRQQVLRDAFRGLSKGPALTAALVASIASKEQVSANAAIAVLASGDELFLSSQQWRQVAAVAAAQRGALLPDVRAAVLLAERGPPQCFATVALCAFRHGPEDAEDRQVAVAALGRFDREEVLPWLADVARSGVLGLEAVGAVASWAMRRLATCSDTELGALAEILGLAAGQDSEGGVVVVDAWLRWAAIDLLCRCVGSEALPVVAGAVRAGAEDAEAWLLPSLEQRLQEICPDEAARRTSAEAVLSWMDRESITPATMPSIPSLYQRALARSPRISRRAMALLDQRATDREKLAALRRARAAVEQALVARKQLIGSFLTDVETDAVALDAHWRPIAAILDESVRAALVDEERRWLGDAAQVS